MKSTLEDAPTTVWEPPQGPANLPPREHKRSTVARAPQDAAAARGVVDEGPTSFATQHYGPTELRALLDCSLETLARRDAGPGAQPQPAAAPAVGTAVGPERRSAAKPPASPTGMHTVLHTPAPRGKGAAAGRVLRGLAVVTGLVAVTGASYSVTRALYRSARPKQTLPSNTQAPARSSAMVTTGSTDSPAGRPTPQGAAEPSPQANARVPADGRDEAAEPAAEAPTEAKARPTRTDGSQGRKRLPATVPGAASSPREKTTTTLPMEAGVASAEAARALFAGEHRRAAAAYERLASDPDRGEVFALLSRLSRRRAQTLQVHKEVKP